MNKEIIMEVLRKRDLSIRYFENARELLKKAKEDGISYLDIKLCFICVRNSLSLCS
jgi:FixJ family two-component response regulator